ncbi:MAG TPA: NAD+ synthase [Actinomycetota bacterium]|jgi:NAD+ synthase (glutamine-hydrolysing)|nr:NAD+ synthase [Actinomycetota bacterium]
MVRIALAQINPTIGDLVGNTALVQRYIEQAKAAGVDVVAFPELVITGYPPDDLLLKKSFIADANAALEAIASTTFGIAAVIGFVDENNGRLYNAAALVSDGKIRGVYRKHHLPNYGVFDERRFFSSGNEIVLAEIDGLTFGVTVCEDLWLENGPHVDCALAGAQMVININASPYHAGKGQERLSLLSRRARRNGIAIAYVNCVGGGDEVIFDGQSSVVSPDGKLLARAGQFSEELLVFDFDPESEDTSGGAEEPDDPATELQADEEAAGTVVVVSLAWHPDAGPPPVTPQIAQELEPAAEVYGALVLGVRDYMAKNGFKQALIGISGGIDSALTAAIAVDAIGGENVLGISNPSEFTSSQSTQDSKQLAENLGLKLVTMPIGLPLAAMRRTLEEDFGGSEYSVADQNLQARIRGTLWMYVSNQTGRLLLSTGNKSEMAVGYATLYGDMAGGFAVLKDVPKTLVYQLSAWRNTQGEAIPPAIIERPPTAELAPGQLDTDSLPPYDVLDPILKEYVENHLGIDEIAALGYEREMVKKIARMVDRAEYKRRQSAPGIKVTSRAFGRDRRLPITNRYLPE